MQHSVILTLLLFSFLVTSLDANEFRKWTSVSGKYTTEAKLEKICDDGESILLKKRDGKTIKVIIERLCDDDKTYINKESEASFGKENTKPTSTVPVPPRQKPTKTGTSKTGTTKEEPTKEEPTKEEPSKEEPPKTQESIPPITYPFEVALGNTLEDIRARCEIIEEEYDKLSNWRILNIKPKNEALENIQVAFRNENTVGYYRVEFRNPSKKLTISVYQVLKPCFKSPEELSFYDTETERALCNLYKNSDNSSSDLYYTNEKKSKKVSLSFTEEKGKANLPEALKEVLYPTAKEAVLDRLKAPSTAVFPPREKTVYDPENTGTYFILYITVDAQNSYGAMLRNRYAVKVNYKNGVASVSDDEDYSVVEVKRGETRIDAIIRIIKE